MATAQHSGGESGPPAPYAPTYPVLQVTDETTDQEIFDAVVGHLAMQGQKARVGRDCQYRTPEGLACAVGCLMEDDVANAARGSVSTVCCNNGSLSIGNHERLLTDLQGAHDGPPAATLLIRRLRWTATSHNLSPAILTELAEELGRWEG